MSKRLRIILCLLMVAASMAFAIDDIYYWPSTSPAPSAKTVGGKTNTNTKTKADTVVVTTPKIRVVNEQDTTVTIVVRR